MAVERQAPDVLAMILADAVLRDCASGKLFIQGTYSAIFANEFPVVHPLVVYTAITAGHGQTELEMRLVDVDEDRPPLFKSTLTVHFPDPLFVFEGVFALGKMAFPAPGEYRIQLFGAGQPIRERRLQVIKTAPPREKGT